MIKQGFLHKFSIPIFILLAVMLGGGVVILAWKGIFPPRLALSAAVSVSVAGLLMIALLDGRAGLKLVLERLMIWRVGASYWLFALFFLPAAVPLGLLANPLFGADRPDFRNLQPPFNIAPMFVLFFLVAGLGEELGWTAFLLPRLQKRCRALTASLVRAVLMAVWHLTLLIIAASDPGLFPDFPYGYWIAQIGFVPVLLIITLALMWPWSIFFTWMFNNTRGSLLLVSILHGSEIWLAYWLVGAGLTTENINNYWGYAAVLVLTAAFLVITNGPRNLSRKHNRIVCG